MDNLIKLKDKTNIFSHVNSITLDQIFNKTCDSIYVTNSEGNVILANEAASQLLQVPIQTLIGSNIKSLIAQGCYNRSTSLEALKTKQMVIGLVKTASGKNIMSASIPIIDNAGEVTLVITNSRTNDLIEKYIAEIQEERDRANQYKNQMEYLRKRNLGHKIIAENAKMKHILELLANVSQADSTVLLFGESGTGKEVLAHYIHANSTRSKEAFIPVDCASIPETLMESEFFGYEKGAFTGASTRGKPGLFELANKGTLFLDEIAEMPLTLQSKLLRTLETNEVRRVGGTTINIVDIRLICATDKDLRDLVRKGLFRKELYYRLNVIPVNIPPLRDRSEDIVALTRKFLHDFNKKYGKKVEIYSDMMNNLVQQEWPGNVRELRNVVERYVITDGQSEILFLDNLDIIDENEKLQDLDDIIDEKGSLKDFLQYMEEQYICKMIQKNKGKIGFVANQMGIHRSVLYRKMQYYGINYNGKLKS